MPTAMTYDSLVTDMKSYLERGYPQDTEVLDQIPRLINLAERAIARSLRVLGLITPVTGILVAGQNVYSKPDRWRRTISMRYGVAAEGSSDQNVSMPIYPRAYEYCRLYAPDSTVPGPPEFYADYDYSHWLIVPTPDRNYPWEEIHSQQPPLLGSAMQSNWLTNYAPDVLLYRALLEATPYLKNDERIPVWQGLYEAAMSALDTESLDRVIDRSTTRKED